MLILARKVGEVINIGKDIQLTIVEISGGKVRIGFEAPRDVEITRPDMKKTYRANHNMNNTTNVSSTG